MALQSRPSSSKSSAASQDVSTAKGTKKWLESRRAYFASFSLTACAATAPARVTAVGMCEGAYVPGHMASQTGTFPRFQGMIEHPLGRFLSDL